MSVNNNGWPDPVSSAVLAEIRKQADASPHAAAAEAMRLRMLARRQKRDIQCPKCGYLSGDDWSQCKGECPMIGSPHYIRSSDGAL